MSTRRRYRTAEDTLFARLMQQRELAGFVVSPLPPLDVRDRYLDTPDGALTARGYILRIRTHRDETVLSLRRLGQITDEEIAVDRLDEASADATSLPDGPVRAEVGELIGDVELEVLLEFRQYRAPRALREGERLALVASLDVVADQTVPDHPVVSNEIEVECLVHGTEDDLDRLHGALIEAGLEPDLFTKFERGFFRRGLREEGRLLLLPRERQLLEGLTASQSAVERRRAEALLLAAQGEDDRTISRRVGLAPSRVRHWREAFRAERSHVFEPVGAELLETPQEDVPSFTLTELVGEAPLPQTAIVQPATIEAALERLADHGVGGWDEPEPEQSEARAERDRPESPRLEHWHEDRPLEDDSETEEPDQRVEPRWTALEAHGDGPPAEDAPLPPSDDFELLARPVVDPDGPQADAAATLLASAAAKIEKCVDRVAPEDSLAQLRSAIAALGQARLALALGESLLSESMLARLRNDLAAASIALREGAGFAYAAASVTVTEEGGEWDSNLALALAQTVWSVEHRRCLDNGDEADSLRRLPDQMRTAAERLHGPTVGEASPPLCYALPSLVWERYGAVRRAVDTHAEVVTLADALEAFEHSLCLLPTTEVPHLLQIVASVRAAFTEVLSESDLAARLGHVANEWLRPAGTTSPEAIGPRREAALAAAESARERAQLAVRRLVDPAFRHKLGRAVASI